MDKITTYFASGIYTSEHQWGAAGGCVGVAAVAVADLLCSPSEDGTWDFPPHQKLYESFIFAHKLSILLIYTVSRPPALKFGEQKVASRSPALKSVSPFHFWCQNFVWQKTGTRTLRPEHTKTQNPNAHTQHACRPRGTARSEHSAKCTQLVSSWKRK